MPRKLTLEQRATNYDTMLHIQFVAKNLNKIVKNLLIRGEKHDASKLASPEVEAFTTAAPLKTLVYDSPEYKKSLEDLKPALDHHYKINSHHPQHYSFGVDGMDLIDLIEMFCDWHASTKRNKNGDIKKSLELNAKRFGLSTQLFNILYNSVRLLEK